MGTSVAIVFVCVFDKFFWSFDVHQEDGIGKQERGEAGGLRRPAGREAGSEPKRTPDRPLRSQVPEHQPSQELLAELRGLPPVRQPEGGGVRALQVLLEEL